MVVWDDGSLVYPRRGDPPADRQGYVRDPTNPYILLRVLKPCRFRESSVQPCNCPGGGGTQFTTCKLGIPIRAGTCDACIKQELPPEIIVFHNLWEEWHRRPTSIPDFLSRLPCSKCREDFDKILADNKYDESQEWFRYSVDRHNDVNVALQKSTLTYAEAQVVWASKLNQIL